MREIIKNNWSRLILEQQIKMNLFKRQGKLQSNFGKTLKKNEANILEKSFKKSYVFDFLSLSNNFKEKELEDGLVENLSNLILELGKGFAFIGRQYKLKINNKNFYLDLLFYNFILKRFVIIELKNSSFKPKYVGQIGFYMSVINKKIKTKGDKETVGLIICKSKNKTIVEYALENISKPTGVAEYKFINLPDEIVEVLPNEDFFKKRLKK
jgi:predicted nuclease of restriction endonuclease-like (RecB) superfamily